MISTLIRTVILVVLTILFVQQARQAGAGTIRQRAFTLAAMGVAVFALLNLLVLLNINVGPLLIPGSLLAVILLAISAVLLVLAWRRGEMREQIEQVRTLLDEERRRR